MTEQLIPTEEQILKTLKHGSDYYVAEPCPKHKYDGHGWPSSVDMNAGELGPNDCATCYQIWRQVHINPGTEHAGQ